MFPPNIELLYFIHPGGLHGEANKNRSGLAVSAARKSRHNVISVVVNAEALEVRIGRTVVVAVCRGAVIARANRNAPHAQGMLILPEHGMQEGSRDRYRSSAKG